jgi:hypothetical protein
MNDEDQTVTWGVVESLPSKFGIDVPTKNDSAFPKSDLVNDDLVHLIRKNIMIDSGIYHRALGSGNEITRWKFTSYILTGCLQMKTKELSDLYKTFHFRPDRLFWGPRPSDGYTKWESYEVPNDLQRSCEVFLCATRPSVSPKIMYVQQALADQFDQARAHCYTALFDIAQGNVQENKLFEFPVYGAITNGLTWIFVKFTPKLYDSTLDRQSRDLFVETEAISIGKDRDLFEMQQFLIGIYKEQEKVLLDLKLNFETIEQRIERLTKT